MKRFSEEQFRVYEGLIHAAVEVLPAQYLFETPWRGYSQATVSRNLREAVQALHANQVWQTAVNRPKFERYFSQLEVAEPAADQVALRLRSRGQRATATAGVQCPNVLDLQGHADPVTISTLLSLAARNAFVGLRLVNSGMTIENVQVLVQPGQDVVVMRDGEDIAIL